MEEVVWLLISFKYGARDTNRWKKTKEGKSEELKLRIISIYIIPYLHFIFQAAYNSQVGCLRRSATWFIPSSYFY